MTPVIAIVGRPNVGKSTLYNRLSRTRDALVADMPGVTRDRRYGFARRGSRRYILVDTGGLGGDAGDDRTLAELISKEALKAIEEADAVLWLVDGRAGLVPADLELATQLRPLSKRLHLVVNKSEGLNADIAAAEFHDLGVGDPLPVSAEHGEGVNDLIDLVLEDFPEETSDPATVVDALSICIVGRPNVGKSTLLNRLIGEQRMLTSDLPGTTRDSIDTRFERRGKHYVFVDTAGVRRRARVKEKVEKLSVVKTLRAMEESSTVLAVMDASEGITEQDMLLLGLALDSGKSLIIAVNKWDGLDTDQRALVHRQIERKLGFVDYAITEFISALHGTGVGKLFDAFEEVRVSQRVRPRSAEATALMNAAVDAYPPPLVRGRRIKFRYAHVGGHDPLRIIIHGNQTERVPETYRRYLGGALRKALKLAGTPVIVDFKHGENPYKGKKNVLTKRQKVKRRRMVKNRRRG